MRKPVITPESEEDARHRMGTVVWVLLGLCLFIACAVGSCAVWVSV